MITDNKPGSRQHRAGIERPKWVVACRRLRLPGTAVGQGKRGEGAKAGQGRCGEVAAARSDHGEEGRRDMDKPKSTYERQPLIIQFITLLCNEYSWYILTRIIINCHEFMVITRQFVLNIQ